MENIKTGFIHSDQVFMDKNLVSELMAALDTNSRRQIINLIRELPTRLSDADNKRFQTYCGALFIAVMPTLNQSRPGTQILFMENLIRIQRDPSSKNDITQMLVNMLRKPEMVGIPDNVASAALLCIRTALASRDKDLANKSIEIWTQSVTDMFKKGFAIDAKRIIREASACTQLAFYQPMQEAVEQMKTLSLDKLFERGLGRPLNKPTPTKTETPKNYEDLRAQLFPGWVP